MENETPNYPDLPECDEPPSMYWEGEDGEGYKEDDLPCLVRE